MSTTITDETRVSETAATNAKQQGWWSRAGGGREVLSVAAPLVVSSLSWTVMTFVDRMLLNHWSGAAMAAAFVASTLWWTMLAMPMGVCSYTATFVAQYFGSHQPERIGPSVWQGVWFALMASPLMLLAIPWADDLFRLTGHLAPAVALEGRYFAILCWGAPAMLIAQSLLSFYSGRGLTVVVMIVDAIFALLNVVLDWWWIFGLTLSWGGTDMEIFPAWGITGAGWATVASLWLRMATYFVLVLAKQNRDQFASAAAAFDWTLLKRMMYFGVPSGMQMMVEVLGFTVFVVLVSQLGPIQSEATSMTFSIGMLAFMPICGLGMATSILVGQHLGENRDRDAAQATWTSLHVALGYMAIASTLMVFTPNLFLSGFFVGEAVEGDPTRRAAVAATAQTLMQFVAAYNFLDAFLIVFVNALKGAGDTRFVLGVCVSMATLLGGLTYLAIEVLGAGLYGCWYLVSAWIAGQGILYLSRFLNGRWRSMRVIEQTVIPEAST